MCHTHPTEFVSQCACAGKEDEEKTTRRVCVFRGSRGCRRGRLDIWIYIYICVHFGPRLANLFLNVFALLELPFSNVVVNVPDTSKQMCFSMCLRREGR